MPQVNVSHLFFHREPMNTSNHTNSTVYPSEGMRVLQMIMTVTIFIVGVSLNALVVWALGIRVWCRNKGMSGETQSADSFRIYVVNLALADLVLLLRTPLMLPYLVNNFTWTLGVPACKLVIYLRCLGLYASAFLLCAVAVERCLCLMRPVWARLKRPRWAVPLACAAIWVLAAVFAVPYISTAKVINWENRMACVESDVDVGQALIVLETVAGFLLPLVIFLSCNIAVIFCAKKAESAMSSPTSASGPGYTSHRLSRLYRVLLLTMLLFLTCWVPYFTCRFLRALSNKRLGWEKVKEGAIGAAYVALFLVYVKSALNPVLYVFAARGLGRTVRASLISTIERVFNEELSESLRRKSLRRRDSEF
ncbi:C3a anaphylatoxin chemotactic receptor-like protein [Labeo rohita]|uniref:C3a anaphylatoxin chemotactic receptor n=2 Tax=Labeo rohita TaxID=84645 RepID=A0ABQ8N151_LABRO|nr:C3a anaphylatoxin chemotactic receptor [Labeo rohita]RXN16643.1 C3a anaphylatoxin chemotactic receptor-like protein [Labeo rohita]